MSRSEKLGILALAASSSWLLVVGSFKLAFSVF